MAITRRLIGAFLLGFTGLIALIMTLPLSFEMKIISAAATVMLVLIIIGAVTRRLAVISRQLSLAFSRQPLRGIALVVLGLTALVLSWVVIDSLTVDPAMRASLARYSLIMATLYGGYLIWQEGGAFWPKIFFYGAAVLLLGSYGVELLMGTDAYNGLFAVAEHNRDVALEPLAAVGRGDVAPEDFEFWEIPEISWKIVGLIIGGVVLAYLFFFTKAGQDGLKAAGVPLAIIAGLVIIGWIVTQTDFGSGSDGGRVEALPAAVVDNIPTSVQVPLCVDLDGDRDRDDRWSNEIPTVAGWNIRPAWQLDKVRMQGLNGTWIDITQANADDDYDSLRGCVYLSVYNNRWMSLLAVPRS